MSYRSKPRRRRRTGLGQSKWIPGQISLIDTPDGRLPNVQALVEAGLPIAPYIEHGSWVTGEPDIMRYGRDPYRGIMGVGLGQGTITDWVCEQTAASQSWRTRLNEGLDAGAQAALVGAAAAGLLGAILKRPLLGALVGAGVGWAAHAVWTSPVAMSG